VPVGLVGRETLFDVTETRQRSTWQIEPGRVAPLTGRSTLDDAVVLLGEDPDELTPELALHPDAIELRRARFDGAGIDLVLALKDRSVRRVRLYPDSGGIAAAIGDVPLEGEMDSY
jgi:hypothetical protein